MNSSYKLQSFLYCGGINHRAGGINNHSWFEEIHWLFKEESNKSNARTFPNPFEGYPCVKRDITYMKALFDLCGLEQFKDKLEAVGHNERDCVYIFSGN